MFICMCGYFMALCIYIIPTTTGIVLLCNIGLNLYHKYTTFLFLKSDLKSTDFLINIKKMKKLIYK